jgi:hypothetical protein
MIKLNDTTAASINVLADGELETVVGGCHGRGWGWKRYGKKHGYGDSYDKGYDKGGYEADSYEPEDSSDSSGDVVVNDQNIELNITINQVAG